MVFSGIRRVKSIDIARSYDTVSQGYDVYFLKSMHRYNDRMLSELLRRPLGDKILDLACGTGYNTRFLLKKGVDAEITLVDLSEGMLNRARDLTTNNQRLIYVQQDMITYLRSCPDEVYDTIICTWAIKYQPPLKIIKECAHVLKKGGRIAVLVNTADTLPEMRALYPRLLAKNVFSIRSIMFDLPNPKNRKVFQQWFTSNGFQVQSIKRARKKFYFVNAAKLVEFLTSTGALAGYDQMIDLRSDKIKKQMIHYFERKQIVSTEHRFIYGIFEIGGCE